MCVCVCLRRRVRMPGSGGVLFGRKGVFRGQANSFASTGNMASASARASGSGAASMEKPKTRTERGMHGVKTR